MMEGFSNYLRKKKAAQDGGTEVGEMKGDKTKHRLRGGCEDGGADGQKVNVSERDVLIIPEIQLGLVGVRPG